MITPPPRSAHGQKYDAANECSCRERGDCYSNITEGAQYCGVGCVGEACLYYQIGCFAGCGTCSYSGKDLYPTPEDLQLADNCQPIEPMPAEKAQPSGSFAPQEAGAAPGLQHRSRRERQH